MLSTPSRLFTSPIMGEDELVCSKPISISYPDALATINTSFDSSLSSTLVNSSTSSNTSNFFQSSPQAKEIVTRKQLKRRVSLPDTRDLDRSSSIPAFDLPAFLPGDVFTDSIPSAVEPDMAPVFSRSYLQSPSHNIQRLPHITSLESLAQTAQSQLVSSVPAPPQTTACATIISQLTQEALSYASESTAAQSSPSSIQLLSDMAAFLQTTMDTCKTLHARIQQELGDHKVAISGHDNDAEGAKHISGTEGHGYGGVAENQSPSLIRESSLLMSDAHVPSAQRTSGRSAPFDPPITSSQNNSTSGAPSCDDGLAESWDSLVAHAPWFTNYDDESNRRPAHVTVNEDNELNTPVFGPQVERVAYPVQKLVEETQIHRYLGQKEVARNVDYLTQPSYNPWKTQRSESFPPVSENTLSRARRLRFPRYVPNPPQRSIYSPLPIACPRPSPVIPVREMEALLEMELGEASRRLQPNFIPAANTTYLPPPSNPYTAQSPFCQYPTRRGACAKPIYSRFSPFSVDTRHQKGGTRYGFEESRVNSQVYEKPPHVPRSTPTPIVVQRSNRPWEAPSPSALPNPPWPGMTPSPPALITFPSTTAVGSPRSPSDSGF